MPAANRSSATAVFELKSAALTLLAVSVKTADMAVLAASLQQRFGDTPGMFDHDPVVIDITPLKDGDAAIDFAALAALLRGQGMVPVAVKGGSASQMAAALQAGFAEAPEGLAPMRQQPVIATAATPASVNVADVADVADEDAAAAHAAPSTADSASNQNTAEQSTAEQRTADRGIAEPATEPTTDSATAPAPATRIVDRPLRSGQQVYARQADLVVMAVVSFGAEVIADGHIHVYGPLRGRAIAGAKGDTSARIFSTCMEPQLISIAGVYRTIDTDLPANVLGKPAQVRLDGDRLVVEPLTG